MNKPGKGKFSLVQLRKKMQIFYEIYLIGSACRKLECKPFDKIRNKI